MNSPPDAREGSELPQPLTSALLISAGFSHGFFTRCGGLSKPPFDSLNVAASVGDDPLVVRENVTLCAEALGVAPGKLFFLSQVHGIEAVVLAGTEGPDDIVHKVGDITLSRSRGVACAVRSADCGTILLAERQTGAVCAIHSGWRGTVQNAIAAGIAALREAAGQRGAIVAAVGPLIEACCFEVGDDVAAELAGCSSRGAAAVLRSAEKPRVDLRSILTAQLEAAGLAPADIDHVPGCTVCDRERFFSFRRDGKRSGRMLSAIVAH